MTPGDWVRRMEWNKAREARRVVSQNEAVQALRFKNSLVITSGAYFRSGAVKQRWLRGVAHSRVLLEFMRGGS